MRISDWSSDVCSSDLHAAAAELDEDIPRIEPVVDCGMLGVAEEGRINTSIAQAQGLAIDLNRSVLQRSNEIVGRDHQREQVAARSEEHTSELQSLMRISHAAFCLNNKMHHVSANSSHNNIDKL